MRLVRFAFVCTLALGGPARGDGATVMPEIWEPVIWRFKATAASAGGRASGGDALEKPKDPPATPTQLAQWRWLEPQIRIRRRPEDARTALEAERTRVEERTRDLWAQREKETDAKKRRAMEDEIDALEARRRFLQSQLDSGTIVAYAPEEPILSGWSREPNPTGIGTSILLRGAGLGVHTAADAEDKPELVGKPRTLVTLRRSASLLLRIETDILFLSLDPELRADVLRKWFRVRRFQVTGHPVYVPNKGEGGGGALDAEKTRLYATETPEITLPPSFEQANAFAPTWETFAFDQPRLFEVKAPIAGGVWEFRISANVLGRFSHEEEYQEKLVEGAIRVAWSDGTISVETLSKNEERKTWEKKE
ncbi:MAG: hypothetical protein ACT4PV_15940 [Planctomycetaceae bacterium]